MLAEWLSLRLHATGLGLCMLCVWQALLASHTPGWLVMTSNQCSDCAVSPFCVSCGLGRQSLPWQQRRWTWLAQAQQCAAA